MKKLLIILSLAVCAISFAQAQNTKMYISKQGGTKKVFLLGKLGYSTYYFSNAGNSCDSLLCRGKGFESCKIEKDIMKGSKDQEAYHIYNKAIRKTVKHIRKTKNESGNLSHNIKGRRVFIKYYNADKKGNADIEIEIR